MKEGDLNGKGMYIWSDGSTWEGEWINDGETGIHIHTDENGIKWEQKYENGVKKSSKWI